MGPSHLRPLRVSPRLTWRSFAVRCSALVATAFVLGCGGDGATKPREPIVGSLRLTLSTTGSGRIPDALTYTVDGGSAQPLVSGVPLALNGLAAGAHTILVGGLTAICSVEGTNPRTVTVTGGAVVDVGITLRCASGAVRVTTGTTGTLRAPGPFTYALDGGVPVSLPAAGAVTVDQLTVGQHVLVVAGLAPSCTLQSANSQSFTVVDGAVTEVAVAVTCAGGTLRIDVATQGEGAGFDFDGYTYVLDGGAARPLPIAGTAIADSLAPGAHTIAIGSLGPGCSLTGANPRATTVAASATTDVPLVVTCVVPIHPVGDVFATVATPSRPYGVAVSAARVVIVAMIDDDAVTRVDLPTTSLGTRIRVGSTPSHIAFDPSGRTAYVANQGSHDVSVVDVATSRTTATLPVGSDAWNVIVSPDGARLYATTNDGRLCTFATATNAPLGVVTLSAGDALRGLALGPDGRTLYVAGRNSGTAYAFDTETGRVIRTYAVGGVLQRMAVSPDGTQLYIANESRGLDVVTLASGTVRTISLGGAGGYGLAMSPDGAQLYATAPAAGTIVVVDRETLNVVRTLRVGGTPRVVAFTRAGDIAVVSNEAGWVNFVR